MIRIKLLTTILQQLIQLKITFFCLNAIMCLLVFSKYVKSNSGFIDKFGKCCAAASKRWQSCESTTSVLMKSLLLLIHLVGQCFSYLLLHNKLPQSYRLKTHTLAIPQYLWGQESWHNLVSSFVSESLTRLQSRCQLGLGSHLKAQLRRDSLLRSCSCWQSPVPWSLDWER